MHPLVTNGAEVHNEKLQAQVELITQLGEDGYKYGAKMSDDMNNPVSVETYAADNDMTPQQVIEVIRHGDKITGTEYGGRWYVTGEVPISPAVIAAQDRYIGASMRSPVIALALAVLIGPVGALYGSMIGGLILILIGVFSWGAFGLTGVVMLWLAAIVVGPVGAVAHNHRVAANAAFMAEIAQSDDRSI